jgi:SpoVK/Ycf46/Vps4 family AAA+-type ATPase
MISVRRSSLFKGPSGTGKTLAARMLAGALGWICIASISRGRQQIHWETEKNLERVFARAEELDVIVLLDEGDRASDAAHQRAERERSLRQLETNYLLQRLESFDGIIVVTTNAADRIDSAFQRRMDGHRRSRRRCDRAVGDLADSFTICASGRTGPAAMRRRNDAR